MSSTLWHTVFFLMGATATLHDTDGGPTVTMDGRASATFCPNVIRARCRVYAEGKSAASALSKLEESRTLLEARLAKIAKDPPRSTFSEPMQLKEGNENPMAKMRAAMMGEEAKRPGPTLVKLSVDVALEWDYEGPDLVGLHRRSDDVRRHLKTLRLIAPDDDDDDDDSSEGDAEKDEDGGDQIRFSIPTAIFYARRLSPGELDRLAVAAFQDARRRAEQAAQAAGRKLGALTTLSDPPAQATMLQESVNASMQVWTEMMGQESAFGDEADRPANEMSSTELRLLRREAGVRAAFALQ